MSAPRFSYASHANRVTVSTPSPTMFQARRARAILAIDFCEEVLRERGCAHTRHYIEVLAVHFVGIVQMRGDKWWFVDGSRPELYPHPIHTGTSGAALVRAVLGAVRSAGR